MKLLKELWTEHKKITIIILTLLALIFITTVYFFGLGNVLAVMFVTFICCLFGGLFVALVGWF